MPKHSTEHHSHPDHAAKHEAEHHHQRQRSLLGGKRRFNVTSVAILAVVLATAGLYFVYKAKAASDTLSLVPGSASNQAESLGAPFTVTIHENSNTDAINAVQADLTYDQTKLHCDSVDHTTSAFALQAQEICANGTINIARASAGTSGPLTLTGDQIVAIIHFTPIGTGNTSIAFATTSAIVRASDTVNVLGATNPGTYTITDTTPPSVPTGVASPSQTVTSVSLAWTASTDNVGVTGYKILRNGVQVGISTTPSFTDSTGLVPNHSYTYTVEAYDAAGNTSAPSTALVVSTKPDTTAPSAPTGLNSPSQTVTSVSLAWTASTDNVGVTGYIIYRVGVQVGISTTPSFTDSTGLTPITSYTYTVKATDAAGNLSAASNTLSVSTKPDTTAPSVPTGLNSPGQTSSSISLAWNASTDNIAVTGYKILRNGTQVGTSATTNYTDSTGLTASTSYSYTVEAYDAAGNTSAPSTALVVSTTANIQKPGDANGDGNVDTSDLSILAAHFGLSGQPWSNGNFFSDPTSSIDIFDFSVLAAHWHT